MKRPKNRRNVRAWSLTVLQSYMFPIGRRAAIARSIVRGLIQMATLFRSIALCGAGACWALAAAACRASAKLSTSGRWFSPRIDRFAATPASRRRPRLRRPARSPARRLPRNARAGVERRIGRLRPPADDRGRDPRRGGEFPQLPAGALAAGRAPRGAARALRGADGRADARPADHGPARRRSRNSPNRSGTISTCWSATRASRAAARFSPQHRARVRCGREGLWRRPAHHHRDLGRRIQLRHPGRRPLGDPLDRDARLRRPAAGLFPRGIPLRAGNPRARRRARRTISRARGRAPSGRPSSCRPSFKRYAVDFDGDGRRDVVDSVPDLIASTANNLKKDGWVSGQTWGYEVVVPQGFNFMLADRTRVLTHARMGARGRAPRRRQGFSARATIAPTCWCRQARRGRAS